MYIDSCFLKGLPTAPSLRRWSLSRSKRLLRLAGSFVITTSVLLVAEDGALRQDKLIEFLHAKDLSARLHGVGSLESHVADGFIGANSQTEHKVTGNQHASTAQTCKTRPNYHKCSILTPHTMCTDQ